MSFQSPPWNALSAHWRRRFGQRVQKIPLDCRVAGLADATCPNRDGTLSRLGCTFCNESGSGSGLGQHGLSLLEQWDFWRAHFKASGRTALFVAYMQSFSNTYGPVSRLAAVLEKLRDLPEMAGISFGTRPDCVDEEKAALLAALPCEEKWLELGVQTFCDRTLLRINRGHTAAASVRAIEIAANAGLQVCVHLMAGLPGESADDFLNAVRLVNTLPVHGIKLHNVYVCRNTALAQETLSGVYTPLSREAYVDMAVAALRLLRKDIVVHRVVADTVPDDLLAPDWVLGKHETMMTIQKRMRNADN